MKILIKNGVVIIDGKRKLDNGAVYLEQGKIVGVYNQYDHLQADKIIDANGHYIIPGLIETHTHGYMGYDFNTCQKEDLKIIEQAELKEGVTCFMASLTCEKQNQMIDLLKMYEQVECSHLLGVHIEGPFLSEKFKGVMKPECLQKPDQKQFETFLDTCHKIKAMTIAPELEGALDLITYGHNKGIVMNIGHSSANAKQVLQGQQYGAKGITHLYNAMSQHLHRDPGVITGAFLSDLMCELIVDGFHIHEDIIRATYQILGKDRIILITDSNPCKGLSDGSYTFSGKNVEIIDGKARVKETGRIAGSTLGLNKACYHMMKWCGCSINDVIQMAAVNPAQLYHLPKGQLEVGYDGDVVIVNDQFDVLATISQDQILQFN
ncbi:MAG: N-acetylglucosamine-6-phosphate deacetylase [Faecalibacillus sp.]